jgi:hypothetical protein
VPLAQTAMTRALAGNMQFERLFELFFYPYHVAIITALSQACVVHFPTFGNHISILPLHFFGSRYLIRFILQYHISSA